MTFEWDATKNRANIAKHGIDFEDARRVFERPFLRRFSPRAGEARWIALGLVEERVIALVYTVRGETIRIISARRAREDEKDAYYQTIGR